MTLRTLLRTRRLLGAALAGVASVALMAASPATPDADAGERTLRASAPAAAPTPVKLGDIKASFSIAYNNGLLFAGDANDGKGIELWFSDGTAAGTRLVKDLRPGVEDGYPVRFEIFAGRVYFVANASDATSVLWSTDGTTAGTVRIAAPSPTSVLKAAGNLLYFGAEHPTAGNELWAFNGRTAELVKDIAPGAKNSGPGSLTSLGDGTLMFAASGAGRLSEQQVWVTDGTAAGTRVVTSANQGNPRWFFKLGDVVVYNAQESVEPGADEYVWSIPYPVGSPAAPTRLTDYVSSGPYVTFRGAALFVAHEAGVGSELWRTDGTVGGTWRVKDIYRGPQGGGATDLTIVADRVLMASITAESGAELWATEGTNRSTMQVADLLPGPLGSGPAILTPVGHQVAFTASTPASGHELWFSNGTAAGTVQVELTPGSGSGVWHLVGAVGETVIVDGDEAPGLYAVRAPDAPRAALCQGREATVVLGQGGEPTNGPDVIVGHSEDNVINGLGGDDIICGKGGNDTIQGGAGDDIIDGGEGNDTVNYAASTQPVTVNLAKSGPQDTGTATGIDVITDIENAAGGSNDDIITGTGGVNEIQGLTGNDTLIGADGDDVLLGGSGEDRLHASLGNDRLNGGAGNDALNGAAGRDDLIGADGDDTLHAAAADDTLTGGPGTDDCDGGTGTDTAATCETRTNIP